MSISDDNKSLEKCILRLLNCVAMKHNTSKSWLLHRHVDIYVHSACTVWSYVCSVCTEQTVLLVPLILLGIINVLVDTSAQIEVTKARERPVWNQQAVVAPFVLQQQVHYLCCRNNYVCGWPGHVYQSMGGQYGGRFKRR